MPVHRRVVGVICHGPWTLIEADVVSGRTLTSWPSLQTDLENAGATWVDQTVCVDGQLISSRNPDDLPSFCEKLLQAIAASATTAAQGGPVPAGGDPVPGSGSAAMTALGVLIGDAAA